MNKKFGPAPNWLQDTAASADRNIPEAADPLKSLFSASRTARLGEEEDDILLDAYRESFATVSDALILAEIKSLLGAECKQPAPFADIYVAPVFTGDVPDHRAARLVILNPNKVRTSGTDDDELTRRARAFLDHRGAGPRRYRNSLVFVVADSAGIQELEADLRALLAWQNLTVAAGSKRLEPKQVARAKAHHSRYRERVSSTILNVFSWLLVPTQMEPEAPLEWLQLSLVASGSLADRAAAALQERGLLRTEEVGLAEDIARGRNWLGDRVQASQLAEEFACQLYLPRISDERLLNKAIQLALSAGIQGRPGGLGPMRRPFTATLTIDPIDVAQNTTGTASELLTSLLSLEAEQLRVTIQIDAQVSERDRHQLDTLLRTLRKKSG